MNKKCALLTIEDLSNFESYDDLLIEPFNLLGWECVFVPWESKSVDWDDFDAVIIRSTWDYQQKEKIFFKTLVKISKSKAKLYNPLSVIKWNINKKYLKDLEDRNIAIIPTKFFDTFDYNGIKKCFLSFETNTLIIKPSISANADDTYIIEKPSIDDDKALLSNSFDNKEYLVQPFLDNIKTMSYDHRYKTGFSDHTMSPYTPSLAVAAGATVIEKHFTLDRNLPGPDHPFALEPDELKIMVEQIRYAERCKGSKNGFSKSEENFKSAMRSIVAKSPIKKGEIFTIDNLTTKRPFLEGNVVALDWGHTLGKISDRDYNEDDFIR